MSALPDFVIRDPEEEDPDNDGNVGSGRVVGSKNKMTELRIIMDNLRKLTPAKIRRFIKLNKFDLKGIKIKKGIKKQKFLTQIRSLLSKEGLDIIKVGINEIDNVKNIKADIIEKKRNLTQTQRDMMDKANQQFFNDWNIIQEIFDRKLEETLTDKKDINDDKINGVDYSGITEILFIESVIEYINKAKPTDMTVRNIYGMKSYRHLTFEDDGKFFVGDDPVEAKKSGQNVFADGMIRNLDNINLELVLWDTKSGIIRRLKKDNSLSNTFSNVDLLTQKRLLENINEHNDFFYIYNGREATKEYKFIKSAIKNWNTFNWSKANKLKGTLKLNTFNDENIIEKQPSNVIFKDVSVIKSSKEKKSDVFKQQKIKAEQKASAEIKEKFRLTGKFLDKPIAEQVEEERERGRKMVESQDREIRKLLAERDFLAERLNVEIDDSVRVRLNQVIDEVVELEEQRLNGLPLEQKEEVVLTENLQGKSFGELREIRAKHGLNLRLDLRGRQGHRDLIKLTEADLLDINSFV